MKNPFGVDQSVNLMDSSLARYSSSYESTPMGEGRTLGRTSSNNNSFNMEDVYLDEASKRGKKGSVDGPFYDNTRNRKNRKGHAMRTERDMQCIPHCGVTLHVLLCPDFG